MSSPFHRLDPKRLRPGITLGQFRRSLTDKFKRSGIDTAEVDARRLIMEALELERADMITRSGHVLSLKDMKQITALSERRLAGEPVDHICGYKDFYGHRFKISKDVLSPRPETEGLVDMALEIIGVNGAAHVLELGVGSGAVIISILKVCENVQAIGTDISKAALEIARANARAHNVTGRAEFIQGDWFSGDWVSGDWVSGTGHKCQFDVIISNPPYISKADMAALDYEVSAFDPKLALDGGEDGLAAYREIISKAGPYLKPKGCLCLEIGHDQRLSVSEILEQYDFHLEEIWQDLAGHDRIIKAQKAG